MSLEVKYKLRFVGRDADENRLPAHEGATSLEGVTFSLSLLANYLATGEIRHRGQLSSTVRVFMQPARQGSFVQDLVVYLMAPNNIWMTSIVGAYAVGTVGQILNSFVATALSEVVGRARTRSDREDRWLSKFPSGDMEALIDRIEPSMRRAHDVIGSGANTLHISKGTVPIVDLNLSTKAWVNTNIVDDDSKNRTVSISAFNANSGNGRAYLPETGKTVPFSVGREPSRGTYENLASSLSLYTRSMPSQVTVTSKVWHFSEQKWKVSFWNSACRVSGPIAIVIPQTGSFAVSAPSGMGALRC